MAARRKAAPTPATRRRRKRPVRRVRPAGVLVAFLGAGNMATALARGLVAAGTDPRRIAAADPDPARRAAFTRATGVRRVFGRNAEAVAGAATVVLAVKPQVMERALSEAAPALAAPLLLSVAAGVPTARIEAALSFRARVVRAMPNTPALVRAGAAAIAPGRHAGREDLAAARAILEAVGEVVEVPEALLDAVTAVSGSGPAYVFLLAEAMQAAAVGLGLPPGDADRLVRATVAGAGRMLAAAAETPADLRARVTSPGGTTEAALRVLFDRDLVGAVRAAIEAAARRAADLGR